MAHEGMEIDQDLGINVNDIEGAQHIDQNAGHGADDQLQQQMADGHGDEPDELDTLVARISTLPIEQQQLLAVHLAAPLAPASPRAPGPLPAQQSMQPMQRSQERAIPPPDPKFDGSTNWQVYSIRMQQWLTACSTPPEQWALRALACLSGPAADHLHSCLEHLNLTYYDLTIDGTCFTWQQFDRAMRSGNFGSPPTDDSVRDKLLAFQQHKVRGQYNTAQHLSRLLLILNEAPHKLDDHTAIWFMRRTFYPSLQHKVKLTAADQPFESLQQFLDAVRNLGPVTDREENEAAKQQPKSQQQQQSGFKRPYRQGPGAVAAGSSQGYGSPAAAAAGGPSAGQRQQPQQRQSAPQQQQQRPQGGRPAWQPSPHAGKPSFDPNITPAEAARRKEANRCYHCNTPMGAHIQEHAANCQYRQWKEGSKRKASG